MLNESTVNILQKTFLFSGCTLSELEHYAGAFNWAPADFSKGQIIFDPQQFEKKLGILLSGRVRVTKQELVVSELQSGDLFGAATLFNEEGRYVSTLTARTRCQVLFLTQSEVQQLMDQSGQVQRNYVRYLSNRIRFLSDKIDSLVEGTGEKKLSAYLLQQMNADGQFTLPCSMTELASRLNVGRATLYREMQKLEERGVLTRSGKTITITRPEILRGTERKQ